MRKEIHRRDFLRFSSCAAAGIAIATWSQRDAFAAAASTSPLLSIGYAPALPSIGASIRLSSADSILTPDANFLSRRARISSLGGGRGANAKNTNGGVAVDAVFPVFGDTSDDNPRFGFWSVSDADVMSGRVRFEMPVRATTGLTFAVRDLKSSDDKKNGLPALTKDSSIMNLSFASFGMKLQRGVYVLAMRESTTDTAPDWRRFDLIRDANGCTIPNAPFAYLVLGIDYAK